MPNPRRPGPRPVRGERTVREFIDAEGNQVVREVHSEVSWLREDGSGVELEYRQTVAPEYSCGCPQTERRGLTCMVAGCGRQSCKAHVAYCVRCRMPLCAPHAGPTGDRCPHHLRDDDGTPWTVLGRLLRPRRP